MKNENNKQNEKSVEERLRDFDPSTVELIKTDEDPDRHMIRYLLSFPPDKRANFLRAPLPNGGNGI